MKSTRDCIVGDFYYLETVAYSYIFKMSKDINLCYGITRNLSTKEPIFSTSLIMRPAADDKNLRVAALSEITWLKACMLEGALVNKPVIDEYEIY